jgi:DNA invertase Pin-like site-specific DNA recombinase
VIYSYRRVSTDEQANGPQAQKEAIERWLAAKDPTFTDPNVFEGKDFFDNGVSGSIPIAERPEGSKLFHQIEQDDEPPTIVAAKLDRLFRSVADAATTLEHWNKIGVKLVAIAEGFDMTSPYGLAMAQMASVFAELERAMIRERTQAALDSKRRRGECIGGTPYGWELVGDGPMMQRCMQEQANISTMLMSRRAGMSFEAIADGLNIAGIPTKIPGGKWRSTQVSRILKRESKSAS